METEKHVGYKLGVACMRHFDAHDEKWPAKIEDLAEHAKEPNLFRNPSRPAFDVGFVYLRPADGVVEPRRVLMYERFGEWGDGVAVLFGDGHAEFIADRARFDRLLAEAETASPHTP